VLYELQHQDEFIGNSRNRKSYYIEIYNLAMMHGCHGCEDTTDLEITGQHHQYYSNKQQQKPYPTRGDQLHELHHASGLIKGQILKDIITSTYS